VCGTPRVRLGKTWEGSLAVTEFLREVLSCSQRQHRDNNCKQHGKPEKTSGRVTGYGHKQAGDICDCTTALTPNVKERLNVGARRKLKSFVRKKKWHKTAAQKRHEPARTCTNFGYREFEL
jgi:hypothetical protein